ncbi:MAG: amidase [Anaerolineales bacterium]|jgi:Asp-tRNA(Asn)/Glu-tRNA(Gln) amidotransferase A subunit family amidase
MDQVELARSFRAGKSSAKDNISQIETYYFSHEPPILAFIPEPNRFQRLYREANELQHRYPNPDERPALFGMLVGVKDIFHANGFLTLAGSRLPPDVLKGKPAESVTRLKDVGALILGKTVTTEFAYFTPGPTRNPHNPEHTPGGSSSGSAAAVGAGVCLLALGTQTIGSVIRPAAFCGAVGLKPTYERISREGVIPLSPSLDHIGFFTPDISTAKLVAPSLYMDWDDSGHLDRRPKLGIPSGHYLACASDYALSCLRTIFDLLSEAGYELRRVPVMEDFQEIRERHDLIMSAEAAQVHKDWFERYEDLYSPKFIELIIRGKKVTDTRLQNALKARADFRAQMTQTMKDRDIDLWICPPTIGPAPKGLDSTGDPVMNLPWTQIGFPALNIPAGKSDEGLPMGLQVIGRWNADEELLTWAEDIEKVVSQL